MPFEKIVTYCLSFVHPVWSLILRFSKILWQDTHKLVQNDKQEIGKDEISLVFFITDNVIKALGMQGNKQQEGSDSEVL